MKYTHIFWDWNGTLIDDVSAALASVNDILARRDMPGITLKQYYTYIDTPISKFYENLFDLSVVSFAELSIEFHDGYALHGAECVLSPGAEELLGEFSENNISQYVLSASSLDDVMRGIEKFGIGSYFAKVSCAEDRLAASKEARAAELLGEFGADASGVLLIGDTIHDWDVARAIGCDCVLLASGHQGRRLLESRCGCKIVDSLFEIKNMIK